MTAKGSRTVSLADIGNALGDALGVKIDTASIVAKVKANRAKLDSCLRHEFVSRDEPRTLSSKFVCTKCGGEVDAQHARWYAIGLEHGAPKAVTP